MSEIYQLSLCELVEKIKSKEISCEDATQSYVDRASRSKKLNCYIEDTFDVALKKASHKIKILIKIKKFLAHLLR